eukprot:126349-Pleurochrysis_carterae.AAC.1
MSMILRQYQRGGVFGDASRSKRVSDMSMVRGPDHPWVFCPLLHHNYVVAVGGGLGGEKEGCQRPCFAPQHDHMRKLRSSLPWSLVGVQPVVWPLLYEVKGSIIL